ncbi:MAG: DUF362 domain-containing protein [Acidobacteriota bacterium]|nr:DUF362 domain-containing protein [Acidobacteriota bacterium]
MTALHLSRRDYFKTTAGLLLSAAQTKAASRFRGKVVAVESSQSIVANKYQAEAVHAMLRAGMTELTGAPDETSAWKQLFERGDVVGIKLNPVGFPHVISAPEVVRGIIANLQSAGIPAKDIVVYDRYRKQFFNAGFDKWLPAGVRISHAAEDYEDVQQGMDGYDPDHYADIALTLPGYDVSNEHARRSYASLFITKQVNKLINLPVLKTHQSAGVTLALKNLSHGLVNNVCRSHSSPTLNTCDSFIPAINSMPIIRDKAVLHILDGVKGLYNGGPSARKTDYVWEHKTMYFATDPVALDHTGWLAIEAKRKEMGMKPILQTGTDEVDTFVHRQAHHIEVAGALGLGEWDQKKITVKRIKV